jgi:hypothetical protein
MHEPVHEPVLNHVTVVKRISTKPRREQMVTVHSTKLWRLQKAAMHTFPVPIPPTVNAGEWMICFLL